MALKSFFNKEKDRECDRIFEELAETLELPRDHALLNVLQRTTIVVREALTNNLVNIETTLEIDGDGRFSWIARDATTGQLHASVAWLTDNVTQVDRVDAEPGE